MFNYEAQTRFLGASASLNTALMEGNGVWSYLWADAGAVAHPGWRHGMWPHGRADDREGRAQAIHGRAQSADGGVQRPRGA